MDLKFDGFGANMDGYEVFVSGAEVDVSGVAVLRIEYEYVQKPFHGSGFDF